MPSSRLATGKLIRSSFDRQVIARVRRQLKLPAKPTPFDPVPQKTLLLLFASRAGSTYAARLLGNTPYFGLVKESFNNRPLERLREEHRFADHAEAARMAVSEATTDHGFAAKCGVPGLIGAQFTGFLKPAWPGIRLVMIRRRDRIAQAVSLFRAELSGQYHSPQPVRNDVVEDDYDRAQIDLRLNLLDNAYTMLERFIAGSGKRAPDFYYEDICDDPRGFVDAVCRHIDLDPPTRFKDKVRIDKLGDEINAAWIARYKAGD